MKNYIYGAADPLQQILKGRFIILILNSMKKILLMSVIVGWLSSTNVVYSQDATAAVHVKLSLAENKTVYSIGDPIKLVMEFTADSDGYQVETIRDRDEPRSDSISVAPDAGVNRWLDDYLSGERYMRDVISFKKLSDSPTRVELLLNDTLRFDRAGRYSVKVTTRRVSPTSSLHENRHPIALTTNEVSFEVQPMSEADEEKEVKRLSDSLDATRDWQVEEKLTQELSYLTGDASSREKVRRFLNSEGRSGNYTTHIINGLFIARNRSLVLQLLEEAMRDLKMPVTTVLLRVVSKLRWLEEGGRVKAESATIAGVLTPKGVDPRMTEIQDTYVNELAASLEKRAGHSQTTTAMTILMNLPKEPQTAGVLLDEVRRLLLQQFDSLHPYDQNYLLDVYWEKLRDPSLVPTLEKMLGSGGIASKNIHDAALKRLIEIAPEKARGYVIAEIRDPTSLVDLKLLESLNDKSLPEVDDALLEQIRRLASSKVNFDSVYLKQKTSLAARYASNTIYADLMQIYRDASSRLPLESRAALLAYFARHNEQETLPMIEQVLDVIQPGQDFNFLPDFTQLYYSDAIDALLVKRLESDEPQAVNTAAYLLSLHGSASDEKVIEKRLERWRKMWGTRAAEAETNLQGTVERELISALITGKAWKLAPERVHELRQSCTTQICRQNFRTQ
ncbi:MAG: hypothetical protein DMF68_15050 [Acidobacteria bacterium]|nr:MAG: hypothetical protein DMF68_15050 [Acidobacteriota bacterium]